VTQCSPRSTLVIGSSTGEPNQMFPIPGPPVILDTLVVEVNEGAGWVAWDRRGSLLYDTGSDGRVTLSDEQARDYYVQLDENDVCWIVFGDGTYGRLPPRGTDNIRASFRASSGSAGNVPRNAITDCTAAKQVIHHLDSVTNPNPAGGGADREDIAHAKRFGPLAFRSAQRAVTLSDYVALAHQAGGVAKVRAAAPNWNVIKLYVAPAGNTLTPVPETLRRRLTAYFEDKRMAGTFVEILDAKPAPIDIALEVFYDKRYHAPAVQKAVEAAVQDLFAFANVDFGQTLYLSDLYGRIEAVPGVAATTVTRFRRCDSPAVAVSDQHIAALAASLPAAFAGSGATGWPVKPGGDSGPSLDLAAVIKRALQVDVDAEGRVLINEFEIPVLPQAPRIVLTPSPR
jgi:predicted phage baseplate assembly protein